jgi:hypothetical protein
MTELPKPGTRLHALGAIILCDVALRRGDCLTLTSAMIELTINKHGESFLSLADDEDAQIEKWGEVKFGLGEFPKHLTPWVKGSPDEDIERARRQQIAWAEADESKRYDQLRAIRDEFGSKKTSRTLHEYR